jgi:hypothetical protein
MTMKLIHNYVLCKCTNYNFLKVALNTMFDNNHKIIYHFFLNFTQVSFFSYRMIGTTFSPITYALKEHFIIDKKVIIINLKS